MRVVVTGMGVWCSIARDLEGFEDGLRRGVSGRRRVRRFDVSAPIYRSADAAVLLDEDKLRMEIDETRIADLAWQVTRQAYNDAGFDRSHIDGERVGVALGTSHGGNIAFMTFVRGRLGILPGRVDHTLLLSNTATIVGPLAARIGASGPTLAISTACTSGATSVSRAVELIRGGQADAMLAGGADLFTELSFSGFNILGATARGECRPLDRRRDGMMLGDGAAMLVLEREDSARRRGARVYAEVAGGAIGNDGYHATAPEPSGTHAARVMKEALAAGHVDPSEVDYVNLHGTGTVANDEMELRAIRLVFGERAPEVLLSSTKSMIGHTLGAAGSVELVATVLGVARDFAPPSLHIEEPIEGFEHWSFVRDRARPARLRAAISNSFGFAGNLAAVVVRRAEARA